MKELQELIRHELKEVGLLPAAFALGVNASTPELSPDVEPVLAKVAAKPKLTRKRLALIVRAATRKFDLPPGLLEAIIHVESRGNPDVVSERGAQGLMQLMPATAAFLGVDDAFDPVQNVMGGAKYVSYLLSIFDGDLELAVAAYNAGPGNVRKHGGVPPFKETQDYVEAVFQKFDGQ